MDELRNEILVLMASLEQKKKQLFSTRLEKIYGESDTISDLVFHVDPSDNTWSISYTHTTDHYNPNSYIYEDSDAESNDGNSDRDRASSNGYEEDIHREVKFNSNRLEIDSHNVQHVAHQVTRQSDHKSDEVGQYSVHTVEKKITQISFGKLKKYFLKGGIKFNIYRNSNGELRIINSDYEFELDLEEQKSLILKYTSNKNVPEWLALKVFLYISYNKWDDRSIINHLSVI
jgi:hypothetical protein